MLVCCNVRAHAFLCSSWAMSTGRRQLNNKLAKYSGFDQHCNLNIHALSKLIDFRRKQKNKNVMRLPVYVMQELVVFKGKKKIGVEKEW